MSNRPPNKLIAAKTYYAREHHRHVTVFNSNVCVDPGLKIWYGDLDLSSPDESNLLALARVLDRNVYVLEERDVEVPAAATNSRSLIVPSIGLSLTAPRISRRGSSVGRVGSYAALDEARPGRWLHSNRRG